MSLIKWGVLLLAVLWFSAEAFADPAKTRNYLTTGAWYPREPQTLEKMVDDFLQAAKLRDFNGSVRALIAPHAGFQYSGACAASAYKQLEKSVRLHSIRRVIVLGVAHNAPVKGAVLPDFEYDSTPLGAIPIDTAVVKTLAREKGFSISNEAHQYEHSIENQLPFLQRVLKQAPFKVVPILFGRMEKEDFSRFAAVLKPYADEFTLIVASTDFTHYGAAFGYIPFENNVRENLTRLDQGMTDALLSLNFDAFWRYKMKTNITMCGFAPVGVLLKMLSPKTHDAVMTDYYKSGDRNGDYSQSVSYAAFIFTAPPSGPGKDKKMNQSETALSKDEQKVLLSIARETLQSHLEQGRRPDPDGLAKKYALTAKLEQSSGVFVTLRKRGALRGCIGSIIGSGPLYLSVRDNAVNSAVSDYRFPTVTKNELKDIDIEISVMTPLQPISDYQKIRLGVDGVIIRKGSHQAVFLPQVADETGWSLDEFLGNLCMKAGLPYKTFKEAKDMEFLIFQAQVFAEKE